MKIAVATDGRAVATYLHKCSMFSIANISAGSVKGQTRINNPGYTGAVLVDFLSGYQVEAVLVGTADTAARQMFSQKGMKIIVGVSGNAEAALNKYAATAVVGIKTADTTGTTYDLDKHKEVKPRKKPADKDEPEKDKP